MGLRKRSLCRASASICMFLALVGPVVDAAEKLPLSVRKALAMEDYEAAIKWLEPAAQQGEVQASYALGKLYELGLGVQQNTGRARALLEVAARADIADAQYLLAHNYEHDGNESQAQKWFETAAANGHQRSKSRLQELASGPQKVDVFRAVRSDFVRDYSLSAADLKARDSSGATALIAATRAESKLWVSALLVAGSDVSAQDDERNTALHYAVQSSDSEIAALLVRKGAKASVANGRALTPLHLAVGAENYAAVEILLKAGASALSPDAEGWTPLMIAQRKADARLLKLLDPSGVQQPDLVRAPAAVAVDSDVGLAHAVRTGNLSMLKQSIAQGGSLEALDESGKSLLHRAVELQKLPIVSELLRAGANTNAVTANGSTAAMLAAGGGSHLVLSLLVESHADLQIRDSQKRSVLHYAVQGKCRECVDLLLSAGASVDAVDAEGVSALLLAARSQDAGVDLLLATRTRAPDVADDAGRTALWWAVKLRKEALASQLLRAGARPVADDEGIHPLHLAAQSNNAELIGLLVAGDAAVLEVATAQGNTPLMLAAHHDSVNGVAALLGLGAEIDPVNQVGDTALLMAVKNRSLQSAELLVQKGASTNRRNLQRQSANSIIAALGEPQWQALIDAAPSEFEILLGRVTGRK